ncbi:unnamed protein product, partial [Adineta ricciae]
FVTVNGDIYVENGDQAGRIEKWRPGATSGELVVTFPGNCFGLFIDIRNHLYCSVHKEHQVVKLMLDSNNKSLAVVAGTRNSSGSDSNKLNRPCGIFVDVYFSLYVADSGNNRIQVFLSGESNGITVAGGGVPNGLELRYPSGVILDASNVLYVADNQHHRVVRVEGDSFRCLFGCTKKSGPASSQLYYSYSVGFDSQGNLYVADEWNARIQKFNLEIDSCGKSLRYSDSSIRPVLLRDVDIGLLCFICISRFVDCREPFVKLTPSGTLLSFRQNQHIYISSTIEVNCADLTSIAVEWSILICTSVCTNRLPFNHSIHTTSKDLFIPSGTLSYGLYRYRLILTATMHEHPLQLSSSSAIDIQISSPLLVTNLISFDTQFITYDYQLDLVLNPGQFSYNKKELRLNANDWDYFYYCRTYPEDPQGFQLFDNQSRMCFPGAWKYLTPDRSSMKISTSSLNLNQTYQLMVQMIHRKNSSVHSFGYLIVRIDHIPLPMIIISCVIVTTCSLSHENFHYVNQKSQLLLLSSCLGARVSIHRISWTIYVGSPVSPLDQTIHWIPYKLIVNRSLEEGFVFAGLTTNKLAVMKGLFAENHSNIYWRFEVSYSFLEFENQSQSYFDIELNQPPINGSCSIYPLNGTTTTLFTIQCTNWFDQDEIKDYLIYGQLSNSIEEMLLAHTVQSALQLYLPVTLDPTSTLQLKVKIRDEFDCSSEYSLPPVRVHPDVSNISQLIDLLHNDDKSIFAQIVSSIVQLFNQLNYQTMNEQVQSGIALTEITVTSLHQQPLASMMNVSILNIDERAKLHEDLILKIIDLSIATSTDLQLQSTILSQITQTSNQLTRNASVMTANKCSQLSALLKSIANTLSSEDTHFIATHLLQCAVNSFNGIYGSLQKRAKILPLDLIRTQEELHDDSEYQWHGTSAQFSFFDTDDDAETVLMEKNRYYQNQEAKKISNDLNQIISSITSTFLVHLNVGQQIIINTSAIFFSLEKVFSSSIAYRLNDSQIRFPSNLLDSNSTVLIRNILQPLASSASDHRFSAYTNLSRSLSLSILDENGTELNINTNLTDPIEFFIPRDPQLIMPSAFLQNSTLINEQKMSSSPFYFYLFDLQQTNPNLTFAIHLEIHLSITNVSYLLTYQFDPPKPLSSLSDHWTFLCPSSKHQSYLTSDGMYVHFLNNHQTSNRHSIVYGLRQLSTKEMQEFCYHNKTLDRTSSLFRQAWIFTSDYQIRMYQSACFYLDSDSNWQSNGLLVGSLSDHYATQCFSTRI